MDAMEIYRLTHLTFALVVITNENKHRVNSHKTELRLGYRDCFIARGNVFNRHNIGKLENYAKHFLKTNTSRSMSGHW